MLFDYLYEWRNLEEDSPLEDVRNQWLYFYGSFARKDGLWFPCTVNQINTIGGGQTVTPIIIGTADMGMYPQGMQNVDSLDVLYSVFPDGRSIRDYIKISLDRKEVTDRMLNGALERSLSTEILYAPKRLMNLLKKVTNRGSKTESYVMDDVEKDKIGAIPLPQTADIIEKLWNSNDWAIQEISQLLGISYNPAHGKKERMLQNELLGDRDLTLMNRRKVTMRLISAAKKFGEEVTHISTAIDVVDRDLPYERDGYIANGGKFDYSKSTDDKGTNEMGEL